jgi:DNA-binding CsgD family transcriptional regulator
VEVAARPKKPIGAMGVRVSRETLAVVLDESIRLHGRESEGAAIDGLLQGSFESRSGALVLRSEAGVGKSSLLAYALRRAAGMNVLQTVGVEPEIDLPFAALHRLLRPVVGYVDLLPDVQASALRSALAIGPGEVENRFVVAVAVLSLLGEVAAQQPVLCLIDDAHWLDHSSADALAFVARRLEAEGVVMLFAVRDHDGRSFPSSGLPVRRINELDSAQAEDLLVERFGSQLAPEVRHLVRESAQGNPLALLEIPEELTPAQRAGRERLPRPMPIGRDLEEVFLQRVHRLPAPAQMLLLIAAADGSGETDVIFSAASRLGLPPAALADAEAAGLIRTQGTTLTFRHPILRGAIYQEASLPNRQLVHTALAESLSGEMNADRRAWHRAALLVDPDDEIADELERTAERARARSGHAAAAAGLKRAAELTSSDNQRAHRLTAAARAAWDAGRPADALSLLHAAEIETDADVYAELRHVQGEIEFRCGVPLQGATLLMEGAQRVAKLDPHKALEMFFDAAYSANWAGDLSVMVEAGRRAADLVFDETAPEAPLVEVLAGIAEMAQTGVLMRLAGAAGRLQEVAEPRWLIWSAAAEEALGNEQRSDRLQKRAEAIARSMMAVGTLTTVLEPLAWRDMMHGRVGAASLHSEEGLELAIESGLPNPACFHRAILAWAAAVRGDKKTCFSLAEKASETATRHGLGLHHSIAKWAVGILYLSLGEWEHATKRLEDLSFLESHPSHRHVQVHALPDLVEAATYADRLDVAEAATNRFTSFAREGAPHWQMALATRCRALMASTLDKKGELLLEALTYHAQTERPFSRARTLLLLGEHLRRERRRKEARTHLRDALDTFEQLGAVPWERRARAELRATGERTQRRKRNTLAQLTPQQTQIATLVAEGATNKEVAAQLFLSPRTVDYHLRNIFVTLGIRSRSELIRLELEETFASSQ